MTRPTFPPALRRTLYLRRRTLAALCAFGAVLATLLALAPPTAPTVSVLAAASALPGGTVLTSTDLVAVELPPGAVPDGAARVEADVVGRAPHGSQRVRGMSPDRVGRGADLETDDQVGVRTRHPHRSLGICCGGLE